MLRIRIATSSAMLLLLSGLTAGSAAAQTATDQTPGSPLQLLLMLKKAVHPQQEAAASPTTARPHAGRTAHSAIAAAKQHPSPTQIASAAPASDAWPAANAEPQVGFVVTEPSSPSTEPNVSELVVAGQTVKVASPDDINEIDLAADDQDSQTATSMSSEGAASLPAMNSVTSVGTKSDSLNAAPSPQQTASPVGSAAWLAQVIAALGGAIVAGSAAWFLMGAAPQRSYG